MRSIFSTIGHLFGLLWKGLDGLRKVLHLIVLLVLFMVILAALTPELPMVPATAALVVQPEGRLVEQLEGGPLDRAIGKATGDGIPQTLVHDLVRAIELATEDDRIQALVLRSETLAGGGLSKLQYLGEAISRFRESGKKVIAYGDYYSQDQYYLAAHADEIYLHPYGLVYLDGYERFRTYYKEAIDKLSIDWHVFSVGDFKSFAEPYSRGDMSEYDKEASRAYLEDLWRAYRSDVVAARDLDSGTLSGYADGFVSALKQAEGDLAAVAQAAGLVDELWTSDQLRSRMRELVGSDEDDDSGYRQVDASTYLAAVDGPAGKSADGPSVAVIVASGGITEGNQPPGTIGSDTIVEMIHQARDDEDVAAVVLRVDSGGGSRFASEVIRRELELLRQSGKPVVVSMSSVAASGGYWIALAGDRIFANPTTLTGSIGIVAMIPSFDRSLERIGINVDGVGTTRLSGAFRPDRGLSEEALAIMRLSTEAGYADFVELVAASRELERAEVESLARGRVWTGQMALEMGLVDVLGDLDAAIEAAAELAGMSDYGIEYLEPPVDPSELLLASLLGASGLARHVGTELSLQQLIGPVLPDFLADLTRFGQVGSDPRGLYLYCFCGFD
ncbi:MAG: signal peptide peptidase SppA [Chromatiales bacterium]|jgi:protease-4